MPAPNGQNPTPRGPSGSPSGGPSGGARIFGRHPGLVAACVLCLILGLILPVATTPGWDAPNLDFKKIQERVAYQQRTKLMENLKAPYDKYPLIFGQASNDEDVARIKAKIDRELAAHRETKERAFSAVLESAAAALAAPAIWLIVLAGALFFRSLVFVLPFGFLGGFYETLQASGALYTGAASETYLGGILAGLILSVALWAAAGRLVHRA